ncbi:MAG: branched-chain amino acid ABC transporter permease [Deinococcales bacterium]
MGTALFLLVTGLTNGAIYALLGLGLVLIYNVTRVINIAQGEFVMLGALTAVGLTTGEATGGITLAILAGAAWGLLVLLLRRRWALLWLPPAGALALWWLVRAVEPFHLPPIVAVLVATIAVAFVGAALYRLTIQPAAAAGEVVFLIITTGLYLGLQGLGLVFWGPGSFSFPSIHAGKIAAAGVRVSYQSLFVLAATLLVLALLWLFFERTLFGKALRAAAMNRLGARLVGISPERAGLVAFAISAGISARAGVLIAPVTYATYDMGLGLGLKGYVGAVNGGHSG